MPLVVAAIRETAPGEARVAITPETSRKLQALGASVLLEKGVGDAAYFPDTAYAGAEFTDTADAVLQRADVLLCVQPPTNARLSMLKEGAILIGLLAPQADAARAEQINARRLTAFPLERLPRTTRAQAMDVLSSQAGMAGYKAVLIAAQQAPKFFPMLTTAAGTIRPSKVLVIGAGVAGLQAIATARRLGAVVTATDVRPAVKEQVESLGAKFLAVEDEEFKQAETAGGYAKEMSKEYQAKQAALTAEHIKKQDIIITTALIPGRPAPRLVTAEMVKSMKPGSVLVDLAVERGGNVEGARAGEVADVGGIKIVGYTNVAGRVAASASSLYARNLFSFIETLVDKSTKARDVKWDDELVKATALTKDGAVIHPNFQPKSA